MECRLALTGQHDELVDQVLTFSHSAMSPEYDLEIMRPGQDLYDVAHACLDGLQRGHPGDFRPDLVLVQGDTASVFFGSLVAFLREGRGGRTWKRVSEAGIGGCRIRIPIPEEMFRRLTGVLTLHHFAPTLRGQGQPPERGGTQPTGPSYREHRGGCPPSSRPGPP